MKKREKILRRRYLVKRREREREYYYCEEDIPQTPEGLKPSATLSPKDRPKEKKEVKIRARRFMMEINQLEKYEEIKKNLMSRRTFRYLVSGKEVAPETGKEHIHLYVEFTQSTILTPKTVCNCHVDIVKSKDQAIDYCTKDCEIVDEIGKESHQGGKTVADYINMKDPKDLDPHLFKTWCHIKQWDQSHTKSEYYCPQKEVYYIWGDSCVGKSHLIYDKVAEVVAELIGNTKGYEFCVFLKNAQ